MLVLVSSIRVNAQTISVTPATTPAEVEDYVENVLLGSCVTASNITYTGATEASATFNGNGTALGLDGGILLTTGQAVRAIGPDDANSSGFSHNLPGDPDLTVLASNFTTYDATILEFDFVPQSDTLRFNYIFASEEYPEYVNSGYNDVFGFFISGPGISGPFTGGAENIALIPNTNTPVAIDNVNNGYSASEPASGPCNNCAFYVDNSSGAAVQYDGHTTVLTAEVVVTPCQTYHIKLAVADAGDGALDSGVFLEQGSFSAVGTDPVELVPVAGLSGVPEGCNVGVFVFRRLAGASNSSPLTVGYNVSGTATPGVDYTALPGVITIPAGQDSVILSIEAALDFSTEGSETVVLDLFGGGCTCVAPPSVSMNVLDNDVQLSLSTTGTTTICQGESTSLTAAVNGSVSPYTSGWDNGAPAGNNVTVSPTQTTTYTFSVEDACGGQSLTSTETITVVTPDFSVNDETQCFDGNSFAFQNDGTSGPTVTHFWDFGDGNSSTDENPTHSYASSGTYTVEHQVIFTASNCTASATGIMTVFEEPMASIAIVQDILCSSGANGELLASATNGTAPFSFSWSPGGETTAGISNLASGTYSVVVTDANGCTDSASETLTGLDTEPPVANCQNATVYLDASGTLGISATVIDDSSTDNCGVASLVVSPNFFDCSQIGANSVELTVTDINGLVSTCNATLTVLDSISPVALCQGVNVTLDASGSASVDASQVDNGSSDNCNLQGISVSPNSFSCIDIGANTVTLTATDISGNSGNCTSTVTVSETISPTAVCQDITVSLDANGQVSVTGAQLGSSSTDNCAIDSIAVNPADFTCSGIGLNVVLVTVFDASGNSDNCNANVTVEDNLAPNPLCQNVTMYLDVSGNASVSESDIDNGSIDNCAVSNLLVTPNTFSCADVGANTVNLLVTDVNGNQSSCSATVSVEDTISPTANCQDILVQLDANGTASVTAAQIDNGSVDNCSAVTIDVTPNSFDCTVASPAQVTLSVTDAFGNVSTCQSTVSLEENTPPTAVCQDIIVQLDATGNTSILPSEVDGGSFDNCGGISLSVNPSTFGCSDIGQNTVTLTVEDANALTDSCEALVTVQENINPTAVCQDATVYLDAAGMVSILPSLIDGGSTDNCAVDSLAVSPSSFDCANIGSSQVQLTVFDVSENSDNCTATITVQDTISPNAVCQDISVSLDATGNASIIPLQVDNGSSDACGIANLILDVSTFDCNSLSPAFVELTAEDGSGNTSICSAQITIIDDVAPNAICQNATVYLDASGQAMANASDFDSGSTDNCTVAALSINPSVFDCQSLGQELITLYVEDNSGNVDSCIAVVTILDTISPSILNCPSNITVTPDSSNCQPSVTWVEPTTSDNCSSTISSDFSSGDSFAVGSTTVTYQAIDGSGNTATCSFDVVVEPSLISVVASSSSFACGYNVSCNGSTDGQAAATVSGGCEPYSFSWSNGQTTNPAIGLSAGEYIVTVTDANGNQGADTVVLTEPSPIVTDDLSSPITSGGTNLSCAGSGDGLLQLEVSGGADCDQYSFSWIGPDGFTASTKDLQDLNEGTYVVTITDANGCIHSDSIELTSPTPIELSVFPNSYNGFNVSCFGSDNGAINLEVSGGVPTYSYLWSNTETTQDIDTLTAGSYTVEVTDANGCIVDTVVDLISPTELNIGVIDLEQILCFGATTGFAEVATQGGVPNYSYLWSNGDTGEILNQATADDYQVVVTDANGCQDSVSLTLTQPTQLEVQIDQVTNVTCFGGNDGSATISASNGSPNYSYLWQPSNQTSASAINLEAGEYEFTVTDANGCVFTDTLSVIEPSEILVSTSEDTTVCPESIVELEASAIGGGGTHLLTWNNGQHFGESYTAFVSQTTLFTVVAEDQFGCTSQPETVTVTTLNPVTAGFEYNIQSPCEVPFEVEFVNQSSNAISYDWTFENGATSAELNPTTEFDSSGSVMVNLIALSDQGCSDTLNTTINIDNLPQAAFNIPFPDGCFPINVGHFNQSTDANAYVWNFGDGDISFETSPYHFYGEPGTYTVTLIATNENGCSDTLTVDTAVYAYPRPIADFIPTIISPDNPDEFLLTNTSTGAVEYFWFFGNGDFSEQFEPIYTFPEFGGYDIILTASNEFGCEDTALYSVEVPLDYGLFVPNAMAIGEPGLAGEFRPIGTGLSNYHVWIFDLWGNQLWESTQLVNGQPAEGWNGRYNGKLVPQGSYAWKIEATFKNGVIWEGIPSKTGGNPSRVGSVTIIH